MPVKLERTLIGMVHLAPLPGSPLWAGSMRDAVETVIAGTWVNRDGVVRNPVDPARVRTLVQSLRR